MNRRQLLQSLAGLAMAPQLLGRAAQARSGQAEFIGVWLSPDWCLPGNRKYGEAEVRQTARRVLRGLSHAGANAVFLETFLRGYGLTPGVEASRYKVTQVPYQPGKAGLPPYPHLKWAYRTEVDTVVDPLEIFVEEGRTLGMDVHAWLHLFYWKMDNPEAMLSWHNAPSLWSQLLVEYLQEQESRVRSKELINAAATLFTTTTDGKALARLLNDRGIPHRGKPLGVLISRILEEGGSPPDFLLLARPDDPFPASRRKLLRPIYLNPANPKVQRAVLYMVDCVVKAHPNLKGIHLDHVRYPVDGQGLSPDLKIADGLYNFYNPADNGDMSRFNACNKELRVREEVLRQLVAQIRARVPAPHELSAAVLPSYYLERDNGRYRLGGYDFSSQDWLNWSVDFVVPMLYEMNPYYIRSLLELFTSEQEKRYGSQKIVVYPGVSHMSVGRNGELSAPGWVFFDLKQARDVKMEIKEQTEDLNFGPQ